MTTLPSEARVAYTPSGRLGIVAWVVMLLSSLLPVIFFKELLGADTAWVFWVRVGMLAALIGAATFLQALRPLRGFFAAILVIFVAEWILYDGIGKLDGWQAVFAAPGATFFVSMLGNQLLRVGGAVAMIGALLAMRLRRKDFFLTVGNLKAPIEPVRWLGFPKRDAWTRFGGQWGVYITLGTLVFLFLAGRPSLTAFMQAAPMLPGVLLLAAMNAFGEEMTYRAPLLATLEGTVGSRQALWIAALFFGIEHYYGVPYGVVGVLLASFLGMILSKAMVETRGFFWAWFIHFLQDVAIFAFMAIGSIVPGG